MTGTGAERLEVFAKFCSALRLDSGKAMELQDFQREMLSDYFDGATESLILIPKKNGKSTLLAALALFHLCATRDAECVIGAASRDQATILYDQAAGFVRRSKGLEVRVIVKRGYREIQSRRDSGRIRVLAADVDTVDGVIPTLALVDELHRHRSAGLYGVFRDGLGAREGRMLTISTAGDSETSVLGEMRAAAHRLPQLTRDGCHRHVVSANGDFAMHEWALEHDDDLDDMTVVKRANPASWMTEKVLSQRHDSPSMLPWQWARFACGVWQASESWWVRREDWDAARRPDALRPGDQVTLGFDGSRYGDATALVACRVEDGLLAVLGLWEAPTDGRPWEVPAGEVDARVAEAMRTYRVLRGYFDPPLWQSEIEGWQREYGDRAAASFSTNTKPMQHAVERFRTDLVSGHVHHDGDPDLLRHVLNARTKQVRDGYYLVKDGPTSPEKIDAAVAAVLAYEARCDAIAAGDNAQHGYAFL